MTTPKHVALMNHVRRTYQLEKDDPVHLHIFNILPKKKEVILFGCVYFLVFHFLGFDCLFVCLFVDQYTK